MVTYVPDPERGVLIGGPVRGHLGRRVVALNSGNGGHLARDFATFLANLAANCTHNSLITLDSAQSTLGGPDGTCCANSSSKRD